MRCSRRSGYNFGDAALQSLELDTDVDWRPRVPQWPALGEAMATAIQTALVGQQKPKEALDEAQARVDADHEGLKRASNTCAEMTSRSVPSNAGS